eukprot:gene11441-12792_t
MSNEHCGSICALTFSTKNFSFAGSSWQEAQQYGDAALFRSTDTALRYPTRLKPTVDRIQKDAGKKDGDNVPGVWTH